jgi:hypothetical protein
MIYKKIDLTEAILSNVEQEAAEAFIDMRLSIKKPLTQRSFNQNMKKAALCETEGLCTATEAVDVATDKCWQGVTPAFVKTALRREVVAEYEALAPINSTQDLKQIPPSQNLLDKSWAH